MTRTITTGLALALLFAAPAAAQERGTEERSATASGLTWTFKTGSCDVYEQVAKIKLDQTLPMGQNVTNMTVTSRWTQTVKSVDAKGTATIELRYDIMKMKVGNSMGTVVDFDSQRPEDMERAKNNPQLQPMADMVGKTQELQVTKEGVVLSITGAGVGGMMSSKGDWQAMFLQTTGSGGTVGGSWKTKRVTSKPTMEMKFADSHTLMSLSSGKATIKTKTKAAPDFSKNPQLAGAKVTVTKSVGNQTSVVDLGKGKLESLTSAFSLDMEIAQSVQGQTMTIVQKMTTDNSIKWIKKGTAKAAPASKPAKKGYGDY